MITFIFVELQAQEAPVQNEELIFKSGAWMYDYYEGDKKVTYNVFWKKLSRNTEIADKFKSGKNLNIIGTVIGSIGAACFGYDLGGRLAGAGGNTTLLVSGGAVMVGGMIMIFVGEGKMKKALELYNSNNLSITIGAASTGLGLSFNF